MDPINISHIVSIYTIHGSVMGYRIEISKNLMILKGFKKETHVFFAGIPSNIGIPSKQIDFNGAQTDPNVI